VSILLKFIVALGKPPGAMILPARLIRMRVIRLSIADDLGANPSLGCNPLILMMRCFPRFWQIGARVTKAGLGRQFSRVSW
jgi:hypothetical protein